MSATSELHHDLEIGESLRPTMTPDEWATLRHEAACAAWKDTNLDIDYDTAWRIADAVLRYAMPERIPTEGR